MRLHFRVQGEGSPLLILHGLLGSSDNWRSMAKRLAAHRRVYSVDLRNHGKSPHSLAMNYAVMASDLRELCATENLREPAVLGHSMGGKVAMQLAAEYPEQVEKLIVVDIAPKAYPPAHRSVLAAMRGLELGHYRSFGEIDGALAPAIADGPTRQLVLKNLERDADGQFRWRIGLDEISESYDELTKAVEVRAPFPKSACFVRGEQSRYIANEDRALIRQGFPRAELSTIAGARHWPHVDAPDEFYAVVAEFLSR
jgi:pimeloyl-ACP methyl ester carboxylesterase